MSLVACCGLIYIMKRVLRFLLLSTVICTAVYAQTNDYNVYNPNEYTNEQTQSGINRGGIIEFVMDYSCSMTTKIEATKAVVRRLYPRIPVGTKIGLRVFGQGGDAYNQTDEASLASVYNTILDLSGKSYRKINKANYANYGIYTSCIGDTNCGGTLQLLPVRKLYNQNTFSQAMDKYDTGGSTPLVYGLYLAIMQDLAKFPASSKKKIILLTDGDESCGGDPCAFIRRLVTQRSDIIIDVIMFGDNNFKCLAEETGGRYYSMGSSYYNNRLEKAFEAVVFDSIKNTPQVPNDETSTSQQGKTRSKFDDHLLY